MLHYNWNPEDFWEKRKPTNTLYYYLPANNKPESFFNNVSSLTFSHSTLTADCEKTTCLPGKKVEIRKNNGVVNFPILEGQTNKRESC